MTIIKIDEGFDLRRRQI